MEMRQAAEQSPLKIAIRYDGENRRLVMYSAMKDVIALQGTGEHDEHFQLVPPERGRPYRDWEPGTETSWERLIRSVRAAFKRS